MALEFTQPLTEKSTKIRFQGVDRVRRLRLTSPSVRRLPRKLWILDISQPYRPPWPTTLLLNNNNNNIIIIIIIIIVRYFECRVSRPQPYETNNMYITIHFFKP
jgi:hypothetical protein